MSSKAITECLNNGDFWNLQTIGSEHGFGNNNTLRLRCYAMLLGVDSIDVYDQNGEGRSDKFLGDDSNTKSDNRYSLQISKDIQRNGYSSWTTYSGIQKEHDLKQIEKLLNFVYSKYDEFCYRKVSLWNVLCVLLFMCSVP